jgi:hypothetical protein
VAKQQTQTAVASLPPATQTAIKQTQQTATAAAKKPTATLLPVVTALPGTGGGPIQNEDFPWGLVIVGGLGAIALLFGVRAYRSTYRTKQ